MTQTTSSDAATAKPLSAPQSPSFKLGRDAFKLIHRYRTSADPKTYAVWFEYVAGKNQNLVSALDQILGQKRGITSVELNQLYEQWLRESDGSDQLRDISQAIEAKVAGAQSLVTDAISSADQYVANMDDAKARLPKTSSPDEIIQALDEIIDHTQSTQDSAQKIQVALQSTHDEITQLNSKVGHFRENLMRDRLTKLINRPEFEARLAESSQEALANGYSLTVMVVSVKNMQDLCLTAGMDISEFIVKSLSGILAKSVGDTGVCARFAGTELAVMLPKSPYADAANLARAVIDELDQFKIVKKPSDDLVGYIKCAFGGAALQPGLSPSDLIEIATEQASQAKFSASSDVKFSLRNHKVA